MRYLAGQAGIRQFLDVVGIPTMGNVHEIARQAAPGARVVYVDNDAVAVLHSQAILARNVEPGLVRAPLWRPDCPHDGGEHPELIAVYGGAGYQR